MTDEAAAVYDLKGLKCPLPVMRTRKRLARLPAGARLSILTTDPLATLDIPHFCRQEGHKLESQTTLPDGHRFVICKGRRGGEQQNP
ncbi:sulfurtransferase TusA family protein [Rhizobium sp. YIM 134829]|uniref:sulfurtransferase TusA family protein n=1 Tax=Rhizobium sp. YIM 134829 TaxID=3390453 RepID=UPI00397A1077